MKIVFCEKRRRFALSASFLGTSPEGGGSNVGSPCGRAPAKRVRGYSAGASPRPTRAIQSLPPRGGWILPKAKDGGSLRNDGDK